jgi:PAP2 superfamily
MGKLATLLASDRRDAGAAHNLAVSAGIGESSRARAAARPSDGNFAARSLAAAWVLIAVLALADAVWADEAGIRFTGFFAAAVEMANLLAMAALYLTLRGVARRLRFNLVVELCRRAPAFFYFGATFLALSIGFVVLSYLAIDARLPLIDADLSRIDADLGFNWLMWFAFVQSHPWLRAVFYYAYGGTAVAMSAAVFYLTVTQRVRRCHELLWIFAVTAAATVAIGGLLPAMHAPFYYLQARNQGTPSRLYPFLADLIALRHGTLSRIDLASLRGLVCFPSYHTVLLIMLCYALRGTRAFWAAVAYAMITLPSLPCIGGHYLVDIPGGAAVAIPAILLVRRWLPAPRQVVAPAGVSSPVFAERGPSGRGRCTDFFERP